MAYREALLEQQDKLIEEFDESIAKVVLADYFLHPQHQQSNQRSELPLG